MSETQKFLDVEGVKVLWDQVNLKDYPNNETLIAVLNAIDETKADKSYVTEQTTELKNELLNGAGPAYDTLQELGELIDENTDALEALNAVAAAKQDVISGTAGQFVVIGSDGKPTTKTISYAEGVSF